MAGINDHHGVSASPNSSEEVESHHGTPATKLSPFSPEETREGIKLSGHGIVRSKVPPAFVLTQAQSNFSSQSNAGTSSPFGVQDPFISNTNFSSTTRSSTEASKLSPVASAFTPASLLGSVSSAGACASPGLPQSAPVYNDRAPSHAFLKAPTTPSTYHLRSIGNNLPLSTESPDVKLPLGPTTLSLCGLGADTEPLKHGRFSSDDGTSRSLMITGVSPEISATEIDGFFNPKMFESLDRVVLAELAPTGAIYVKFADIRDADNAYSKIQCVRRDWSVQHIGARHFVMKYQPESLKYSPVSMYEGQILITAQVSGLSQSFDTEGVGRLVKGLLGKHGDIMAFELSFDRGTFAAYRAEYFSAGAVDSALAKMDGIQIAACTLSIVRYQPDIEGAQQNLSMKSGPLIIGQEDTGLDNSFKNMSINDSFETSRSEPSYSPLYSPFPWSTPAARSFTCRKDLGGQHTPSPLSSFTYGYNGRSTQQSPGWSPCSDFGVQSPVWSSLSPGAIGQERGTPLVPHPRHNLYQQQQRGQAKTTGRQYHDYASGHHNVVDVDRIRQGTDVRTTIMLRNIPNKIDQAMLKDIVDETSLGKYDFMYLRIDFANNCNVGYAFINFEDPYYIIDFVNARAGHRWNRYNSDKVAEVSYATIQGRDCLVQKFRNSSVMLEHPSFRPKIFHTGVDALAGTEDKFPGPDNPSKMRRSVENAEHVGLFAPRAGQNFRDEQRRRRSQYDRGTRLAEIEDSYDIDHHDHRNDSNAASAGAPYGSLQGPYYSRYGRPLF